MEVHAKLKYIRISPQKARLVANKVRGLPVQQALDFLFFSKKKASDMFRSLLTSAIANAEHNAGMDIDILHISSIWVDEGPTVKRFRARAKGRGNTILKRTSHVTMKVSDVIEKRSNF
jgi:large subunit ribosomal protein L22